MLRIPTCLLVCLATGMALWGSAASAQHALVRGVVVDSETSEPVPAVHVFLSKTMLGTVTNDRGRFELEGVPPGAYQIVASMVGFERHAGHFEVTPEKTAYDLQLSIRPAIVELNEVEVVAERPRAWRRQLARFEELFIGAGPNADDTRITNPYVLDFEERDGAFYAFVSEPLHVINGALGYEVTFDLTDFRLDRTSECLFMHGAFFFSELAEEDQNEAERWEKNRERTYRGSLQHVLASLIHGRTLAQDITVKLDDRRNAPYSKEIPFFKSIEGRGLVQKAERPYLYTLRFSRFLYVYYRGERSWIELNRGVATIHESGYAYAPAGAPGSLTVYGRLADRRVADLLPRNYRWSPFDEN